jgi:hypothetical protein
MTVALAVLWGFMWAAAGIFVTWLAQDGLR